MTDDGRCDGCGDIIHKDDYIAGECRWCGRPTNECDILDECVYQSKHAAGVLPRARWKAAALEIKTLRETTTQQDRANSKLVERIGELEEKLELRILSQKVTLEEMKAIRHMLKKSHIFHEDVIDAAWEQMLCCSSDIRYWLRKMFKEFGIEECEDCGGKGYVQRIPPRYLTKGQCQSCKGHKWRINEKP